MEESKVCTETKPEGVEINLSTATSHNGVETPTTETNQKVEIDEAAKQALAMRMLTALAASKNRTLSEKAKMAKEVGLLGGNRVERRKMLKRMAKSARISMKREIVEAGKKIA
jgi:hypothetical protein